MNNRLLFAIIWIAFMVISIFILCCSFIVPLPPTKYIRWSERKLQFNDFQLVNGELYNEAAATSCTGIVFGYDTSLKTFHAIAVFEPSKSKWSSLHTANIPYLLNHEQRHFDLTEYIVRKLNSDMVGKDSTLQLTLFKIYQEQLDMIEVLYDSETKHSLDTTNQHMWDTMINNLLSNIKIKSNV